MKILNYIPFISKGITVRYKFTPETINMDGDNTLIKIYFGLNKDKFYYIGFRFDRKLQMIEVYHKMKYNKFVTTELLIKKSDILILDGFDIEMTNKYVTVTSGDKLLSKINTPDINHRFKILNKNVIIDKMNRISKKKLLDLSINFFKIKKDL